MKTLFYIIVIAVVSILVFRFTPVDHEPFHEDPGMPDPQRSEVRLIGLEAPRYAATASEVLEEVLAIAKRDGAKLVQGGVEEGMMTFLTRTRIVGFRDYITVKAVDEPGGAKLAVLARPRLNGYDWGVNQKRLDRWLGELEQTFGG